MKPIVKTLQWLQWSLWCWLCCFFMSYCFVAWIFAYQFGFVFLVFSSLRVCVLFFCVVIKVVLIAQTLEIHWLNFPCKLNQVIHLLYYKKNKNKKSNLNLSRLWYYSPLKDVIEPSSDDLIKQTSKTRAPTDGAEKTHKWDQIRQLPSDVLAGLRAASGYYKRELIEGKNVNEMGNAKKLASVI